MEAYVGHGPAPDAPFKGRIDTLWVLRFEGSTLFAGKKLWVGISAAGVIASEDGGKTLDYRNRRSNVGADDHGAYGHEIGECVHNLVQASG